MAVLRDIFRRKFRALLTIVGVSVGVLALVVLGAFAEKTNYSLQTMDGVWNGKIIVSDEEDPGIMGLPGDTPLAPEVRRKLAVLPGVLGVVDTVTMLLDESGPITGSPPTLMGIGRMDADVARAMEFSPVRGRRLRDGDRLKAVVGSDLVDRLGAEVGGTVTLRDRTFEVVGIAERTYYTWFDQQVLIPIADAQEMWAASLPEAFRSRIEPSNIVLQGFVVAEDGTDADELASRINREVDGAKAVGPTEFERNFEQLVSLFALVVASVAAVALLVGALSVVNTMFVAVLERTRQIGVKRAMGASPWRIGRDVLAESTVMSLLGGAIGLAGGALLAAALNAATYGVSGTASFALTPRLAVGALAFAVVLGLIGGVYPARYAARLDPIDALAHE